jgi:type II secretory pathway pseudopilin PulG
MAALLIALAIMAILMTVAMPVWRQEARREKEAELIFRGEQYARAIALYNYKNGQSANAYPPSIQVLVDGRYLRKKYKDPMTKDGEFMIMPLGQAAPGMPGSNPASQTGGRSNPPPFGGRGNPPPLGGRGTPPQIPQVQQPPSFGGQPQVAGGGIIGVRSKSEENSLRSYRGQTRYDQWLFVYSNAPRPGGAGGRGTTPDGRGNQPGMNMPGGNRGNRGNRGESTPGFTPGGFDNPGRSSSPPSTPGSGGRRGGTPGGRGPG